jgi:hypothetical protein
MAFGQPDPEQALRTIDAAPDRLSVYHQTAPSNAENLYIVLQPRGPDATVESIQLAIAGASQADELCREHLAEPAT